MRDWKLENVADGWKISAHPFWTEIGLPLAVVYNFQKDFLENYCSIWLSTVIFGYFAQMVSIL